MSAQFSTKDFTFNKTTRTLVAEVSSMNEFSGLEIEVTSEHTGKTKTFSYDRPVLDREGDIQYWVWTCTDGTPVKLHILND